jgi:membrane-associated phospholipid phosphatase
VAGRRTWGRALAFAAGLALLLASREEAKRRVVPDYEERLFRFANRAPASIRVPVRTVMQAGTFGTVPAVAAIAALTGRRRLAATLLLGGSIAWFGAKLAKPYGGRPRPAALLDDVMVRETIAGDLGWVSGHTAVATTLALVGAGALPSSTRPLLAGVVATTAFGRMYVGAHLPHDLVGGAGVGIMIAALLPPAVERVVDPA